LCDFVQEFADVIEQHGLLPISFFYKNDKNDKADNSSQLEVRIGSFRL